MRRSVEGATPQDQVMKTIFRYSLNIFGPLNVGVPKGSKFLSIGSQPSDNMLGRALVMWVEFDAGTPRTQMDIWRILTVPTGDQFELPESFAYLGTATLRDNPPLVVHVYREEPKP